MDRGIFVIIFSIIFFIGAAYLMYNFVKPFMHEKNETKKLDYVENITNAFLKVNKYDKYIYEYSDNNGIYTTNTTIIHNKEKDIVIKENPLYKEYVYYNGSSNVVCINYTKFVCSNSSLLNKVANKFRLYIPHLYADKRAKEVKFLYEHDALTFDPYKEEKNCNLFTYHINYNSLTLDEIHELGMEANDPKLTAYSNFVYQYCIDNESNIHYSVLNYSYYGKPMHTYSDIKEIWNESKDVILNITNNYGIVEDEILKAKQDEAAIINCHNNKNTSKCITDLAIDKGNYKICLFDKNKDKCLMLLTPIYKSEVLCELMDDQSYKDNCYYEIAKQTNNTKICDNIKNETLKSKCY